MATTCRSRPAARAVDAQCIGLEDRPGRCVSSAASLGAPAGSSSAARRPTTMSSATTTRSRSGSIGGFVTCANAWRR